MLKTAKHSPRQPWRCVLILSIAALPVAFLYLAPLSRSHLQTRFFLFLSQTSSSPFPSPSDRNEDQHRNTDPETSSSPSPSPCQPCRRSRPNQPASEYVNSSSWSGLLPPPSLTLQELFSNLTPTSYPSSFPPLSQHIIDQPDHPFTSYFLPNPNGYINIGLRYACIEPAGNLLVIGITEKDIAANISGPHSIPSLRYLWQRKYASCGNASTDECAGVRFAGAPPAGARWIEGSTLHFIAYVRGNTFHNFAERVWPRLAAAVAPLNETTAGIPVRHVVVHRLEKLLGQAARMQDRDQVLWQMRMLMEIWPGSSLLRAQGGPDTSLVSAMCFDTLLLQMDDSDRIDHTRLPPSIYGPALRRYRATIFRFLNWTAPELPLPPRPLRVLYYGRSDSSRRRIMNNEEMLAFLHHHFPFPKMEIRSLDHLLAVKATDYSFTRLVALFSQTDILIVAHGAFTWATLFMPPGGVVIEVFGPCDFSKPRPQYSDLTNMRTWISAITHALSLQHNISNPFRDRVPNPKRGNTTLCLEPFQGVPDYTIDPQKVGDIIDSLLYPQQPSDRLKLHWLYDWEQPDQMPPLTN